MNSQKIKAFDHADHMNGPIKAKAREAMDSLNNLQTDVDNYI